MTPVVLDANILIRAVLGSNVLSLLRKHTGQVEFFAPDTAFEEAREHLPQILGARQIPVAPAMAALDLMEELIHMLESETYSAFEAAARERIDRSDSDVCRRQLVHAHHSLFHSRGCREYWLAGWHNEGTKKHFGWAFRTVQLSGTDTISRWRID